MKYYKFPFTGDYHTKADGTHEIKRIVRDIDGNETAYASGTAVPDYGTEISTEEALTLGITQEVPDEITKYQAMEVMKRHNLWEPFKTLMTNNVDVADVWNVATAVKRDFSMITDMKTTFALNDTQIDDMFIEASLI